MHYLTLASLGSDEPVSGRAAVTNCDFQNVFSERSGAQDSPLRVCRIKKAETGAGCEFGRITQMICWNDKFNTQNDSRTVCSDLSEGCVDSKDEHFFEHELARR